MPSLVDIPLVSLEKNMTSTVSTSFFILFVACYISSIIKAAVVTPLRKIPGPWYAPLTTAHLVYLFSQGIIWKYVERQHQCYGPVVRLGPRQVWVSDKNALRDILATTDLPKVAMYAEISRDRQSPGLFGEIRAIPHRNLKHFLGPAFTVTSVDQLDSFFMSCVGALLRNYYKRMDSSTNTPSLVTDFMRDLHCLALDIMGESAFGKGFGQIDGIFDASMIKNQKDMEWAAIPRAIFEGQAMRYRMVYVKRFLRKFGIFLNFDWPREMIKAISSLIDERRASADTKYRQYRQDILQHMLDKGNRPDTGVPMSNREITDQMSELLLAGSETTSGTIACLFLELARNPEVKAKLLTTLPVLKRHDPVINSKTVRSEARFRYLEACIKEGLRKHPIASEMGRRTTETPFQIRDFTVPPYTVVSASYRALHLSPDSWPEPERFWPERWLEKNERDGAPGPDLSAYFPFSAGKHSCIGQNFAYAEIRTVTANILSRFDVDEVDRKAIDFRQFITMQFHDGCWRVKLTPRAPLD